MIRLNIKVGGRFTQNTCICRRTLYHVDRLKLPQDEVHAANVLPVCVLTEREVQLEVG